MYSVKINLPSLKEQQKIASILSGCTPLSLPCKRYLRSVVKSLIPLFEGYTKKP
ncbi:restriction endonuclease subunit S [Anabaena cylindrica FACHB-243]|uniref:restriction endonuclease subunit S n=1 Tax=Anabaena TaxID=1163 RepID=UPI0012375E49|nr:restriction endonuclease subunit S [Anabaena cylindrica FACHB-243]MBY5284188.1 hypothetical protein [Anabaena sp. CCAP 1446/1C]MBY5306435.1 hypothetical protein [Anabaena sp. CCAP 1446/1C]